MLKGLIVILKTCVHNPVHDFMIEMRLFCQELDWITNMTPIYSEYIAGASSHLA